MNGATTIQERLKDLRLNKGLKLEELAEQTGISKSALGSYEKDDYKEINHGNLILLADFYGGVPRLSLLPDREPGGDQHAIKGAAFE